jgi:beta-glucanase (GH16 family)
VEGSRDWKTNRKEAGYTSASATTRGLHGWLYGRFEIRARIDVRAGSWPAFWALGVRGGWPAGGEVDVMEYYAKTLLANVGWAGADGRITWDSVRTPLGRLGEKWAEEFHVWRMDWDERRIGLYVDGRLLNETDLATTLNRGKVGDNPFHRPMYLLLNQAIGGQGGDPGKTEFPVRFEIDYVRVYQQGAPAATRAAD